MVWHWYHNLKRRTYQANASCKFHMYKTAHNHGFDNVLWILSLIIRSSQNLPRNPLTFITTVKSPLIRLILFSCFLCYPFPTISFLNFRSVLLFFLCILSCVYFLDTFFFVQPFLPYPFFLNVSPLIFFICILQKFDIKNNHFKSNQSS